MRKTLYDVLEIPTTANLEAVEASYRSLRDSLQSKAEAGDEESRMRLVAAREAWQTLSNAGRRRLYDASLDARKTPAAAGSVVEETPADEAPFWFHWEASTLVKGALGLIGMAMVAYGWVSYREQEALRLDKAYAAEAKKHALEMEKLAIERERVESMVAEQRKRAEYEKQRLEDATRARAVTEERAREAAQQEMIRAEQVAARQRRDRERNQDITRKALEEQATAEQQRKLARERDELRRICRERYGREDC